MASTIETLFAAVAVHASGVVRWGRRIPAPRSGEPPTGIYVVALTEDPAERPAARAQFPVSTACIGELLAARPELTLDGARPSAAELAERLERFWLPDEVVLYIGRAGASLTGRVEQYYRTRLGARSPHAGGWPLKTLAILDQLWVHFAYCDDVADREKAMLRAFALASEPPGAMPFANLEAPGGRKPHGIRGARAPRSPHPERTSNPKPNQSEAPRSSIPPGRDQVPARSWTQRVTAKDIQRGQVRVPAASKASFPNERTQIDVDLRGLRVRSRWDPRLGPDQERSGTIGIGRAPLARLVKPDESLAIHVVDGVVHLE